MSGWTCQTCHGPCVPGKRRCASCTSSQLSLLDMPRAGDARASDPRTSKIAAGANLSARQTQKKLILKRMLQGPVSSHEAAVFTSNQHGTAGKRLSELHADKLIEPCGYAPKAPGTGGTPRTVYRLTDAGRRTITVMAAGVAS